MNLPDANELAHREATRPRVRRRGGVFLLDAHSRWIEGNATAAQMVADGWWRGRRHAALDAAHGSTREAMAAAHRAIAEASAERPIVPVRDAGGVLVAFATLQALRGTDSEPCFVLYVRPLQWADDEELGAQLRTLFGLTAAESRFAVALRRLGDTAHAAAAVGIAESSARTRLQSIFDKIDVHRLSSLLLLMDALAELVA